MFFQNSINARKPALQQVAKKAFASPLLIPAHTEEPAYGAALFALVSCGHCKNAAEAQKLIRQLSDSEY